MCFEYLDESQGRNAAGRFGGDFGECNFFTQQTTQERPSLKGKHP